jgi:hypothetical protein
MRDAAPITTLFMDIGGVLLSDGSDLRTCKRAAKRFGLESLGYAPPRKSR